MPTASPAASRLAVFDLDGTLVDSAADIQAALNRLMRRLGRPGFEPAEVRSMVGDGVPILVERALAARGMAFDEAALAAFDADYAAHPAVATAPFPGVPAALDALIAEGWRCAICTNKPIGTVTALLNALALRQRFAAVLGGDSVSARKPDPVHLLATIASAGGVPARSVMIGDHRNDVLAARGAGVPSAFACWGYGTAAMAAEADWRVERPAALSPLLARLVPKEP
jgi:phosphoglycolate phosphatase